MWVILCSLLALQAHAAKPNLLFVMVDDLGWADVGFHRATPSPEVKTPHLDGLVMEGVMFNRHYVHMSCTPSRSSFQSGRLPVHVMDHLDSTSPKGGVPQNMTVIAEKLKSVGYKTHFVGKWDAGIATPRHTPYGRGYDTALSYFTHRNEFWTQKTTGVCTPQTTDLWHNDGPALGINGTGYEEAIFMDMMASIITKHDVSEPLFLVYTPHVAHCALQVPKEYYDMFDFMTDDESRCVYLDDPFVPAPPGSGGGSGCAHAPTYVYPGQPKGMTTTCRRTYAAMVHYMDAVVGNVTQMLKAKGMWDNTLMVFTADNGGPIIMTENAANNWPLRGGKYSGFEGGIRATAFASGGLIPASVRGSEYNGMIAVADWYATFCGLAGVDPTDARAKNAGLPPIDSLDVWVAVSSGAASPRGELPVDGTVLVQGDFKYMVNRQGAAGWQGPAYPNASSQVHNPNYYIDCKTGCLFNVAEDRTEHTNLAAQMPEKVKAMSERLDELKKSFWQNSDPAFNEACPKGQNPTECMCWVADNIYKGYLGPYENLESWDEIRKEKMNY